MAYTSPYDPKSSEARSSWLAGLTEAMSIVTKELDLAATPEPVTITLEELPIDDENQRKIYQAQEWNKLWLTEPKPVIKKDGTEIMEEADHFTIDYLGGSIVFEDMYRPGEGAVITADVSHILGNSQGKSAVIDTIQNSLATLTADVDKKAVKAEVDEQFKEVEAKTTTLTQGLETANQTIEANKAEASQALQSAQQVIEESLKGKADLVEGKVNPEQLPEMNYDEKGAAERVKTELTATLTSSINDAKAGYFDITIPQTGWDGGTEQTVNEPKLTIEGYNYLIVGAPENWTEYNLAGVHAKDITSAGSVTFVCGEGQTPTTDLIAHVMKIATKEGE